MAYQVRGTLLALRREQSDQILIERQPYRTWSERAPGGDGMKLVESDTRMPSGAAVPPTCASCPLYRRQQLVAKSSEYIIALAGNPNTGKSTIFNALTGLQQHTGNWPGKTVTRAEGVVQYENERYRIVDLPGTYSLFTATTDEEIARDFILFGHPDCTAVVADAGCLERNLNLVLQILEITDKVVVVLNLVDDAKRRGIDVDHRRLARDLGVQVVPTIATTGQGLSQLLRTVAAIVHGEIETRPHRVRSDAAVLRAVDELVAMLEEQYPGLPNANWVAMRLLDGDQRVSQAVLTGELTRFAAGQPSHPAAAAGRE